jgi:hypothetical protein
MESLKRCRNLRLQWGQVRMLRYVSRLRIYLTTWISWPPEKGRLNLWLHLP